MSHRMGRPPKAEQSRSKSLNIRLTENEATNIEYCAERLKISRTDAIMKGIGLLKKKIK